MISRRYSDICRWLCLCAAFALVPMVPMAAIAEEGEGKKRGLKRLVPFKKSEPKPDKNKAVEDMRDFTASLTGDKEVAPKPAVPEVKAKPVDVPVEGSKAKVEKKQRRGFLLRPFSGDKDEADQKVAKQTPEAEVKVEKIPEVKTAGRRKLIKVPFVGGKDEAADPVEPKKEKKAEGKRSPLVRLPFVGDKDDKKIAKQEVVEEKPASDKKGLKRLNPFANDGKKIEAEKVEEKIVAVEKPAKKEKREKRGLFAIGGGKKDKKEKAPPKPSARDLGTGETYIVTVTGTPFYSIGPSQPLPPDEILNKGKLVTMRKAGWGWSDIELPGGHMGVVATKNLRKATPSEMGGSYASQGRGASSRSLFKVLDFNPAPEPELPSDGGGIPLGVGLLPPLEDD